MGLHGIGEATTSYAPLTDIQYSDLGAPCSGSLETQSGGLGRAFIVAVDHPSAVTLIAISARTYYRDFATEAFKDDVNLLFGGLLAPGSRSDSSDKGSDLLGPLLGGLWFACC
jgi:hypothetical protein